MKIKEQQYTLPTGEIVTIKSAGPEDAEKVKLLRETTARYKKFGFKEYGKQPRAFKLQDGTYRDEIIMVNIFE